MRPAIEVWLEAVNANIYADDSDLASQQAAAAVIEADRLALVAEIVAELRDLDGRRDESNLIGWAANHIEAKFGGGNNGDR